MALSRWYRTGTVLWSGQCSKNSPKDFCTQQSPSVAPTDSIEWAIDGRSCRNRITHGPNGTSFGTAKVEAGELSNKGDIRPKDDIRHADTREKP